MFYISSSLGPISLVTDSIMPGRRHRGPRARRGGGRRRGVHIGDEYLTFAVLSGQSQPIHYADLSTVPKRCAIRPLFIAIETTHGYRPAPASDQFAAYFTPSAIDVQMISNGKTCATSRPVVLGAQPRKIIVRAPRSMDWLSPAAPLATEIGVITSICLGTSAAINSTVRGLIHIRYAFSYEILTGSCPGLRHIGPSEPPFPSNGSWADHVEASYPPRPESHTSIDSVAIDLSFLDL